MHVLISCKNEKVPIKNEGARVVTTFLPNCKSMGIFSDGHGQLTLQSMVELVPYLMVVPVTFKNEEDPIKKMELECSQHYTSIFQTLKGR